jgi:SAM-dependent methyltransferase
MAAVRKKTAAPARFVVPTKIDLGCGANKREGFYGVDRLKLPGVDLVLELGSKRWPFKADSMEEAHCSHFLEHLKPAERIHVVNELYRVLKPEAKVTIITPHWASTRAYGDLTHEWPPVSEFWYYYLNHHWLLGNAPHLAFEHNPEGYRCNFQGTTGYSVHPALAARNPEYQQEKLMWSKDAALDMIATMVKKPMDFKF